MTAGASDLDEILTLASRWQRLIDDLDELVEHGLVQWYPDRRYAGSTDQDVVQERSLVSRMRELHAAGVEEQLYA